MLTLKKAGAGKTVTITATAKDGSGKKATIKITIMKDAVKSIKLKAPSKTLKAGKTMNIKTTINTTGKKANASLSVNGFMTDYSYYSKELADGECAVVEIKLWESSLKNNNISSASDVKEVEIGFEIREGSNTIDEPVIKISFN